MAKFCRFCGRKLRTGSERFCPGCGSDLLGGNNQASQDNGNGWGQPSDDQGIWGRQAASSQGYWRPPQGSSQGNQNRQPENVQNNWTPQPENVQNSWTSQPENNQNNWGTQAENNQNNWGTQLESTQNNRSQQSPEGQEIHNQSSQSRPRNHKLRQINVQGNWNQQRNPGPSGVDQNSPNQQMADTGINTSQPTKSQTNKKPVKTKNTSNAGVSVSSGSSGFYLFDFLTRMFRKSNISVIIYLILNVALVCGFTVLFVPDNIPLGIVIGIVLYLVSVTIALSPIGEWYLRFQTRCKKLKRAEDINRLEPIFREVYAKAKQKDPSLNSSIQLYITDDDSPNAFATGRKTVCVTRGLLNMPDEQIRAKLGHEFGHLAHKDTDLILLISVGNMFVNMLVTFFNIGLWFFDIITTIMCLFMGGEDGFITHLFMIFSRFLAVITVNLLLRIWTGLGTLLVMKSSRGNEFEADEFAFQLGYGDQLCALLDYFSTHEQKASGLFAALASSHPDSHDRIARLQQLGAGYYR